MFDKEIADGIRKITAGEVDAGWADGPTAAGQLDEMVGDKWIASWRFDVRQGQKCEKHLQKFVATIRPMDDLSESLVNSTWLQVGKLQLISVGHPRGCFQAMASVFERGGCRGHFVCRRGLERQPRKGPG